MTRGRRKVVRLPGTLYLCKALRCGNARSDDLSIRVWEMVRTSESGLRVQVLISELTKIFGQRIADDVLGQLVQTGAVHWDLRTGTVFASSRELVTESWWEELEVWQDHATGLLVPFAMVSEQEDGSFEESVGDEQSRPKRAAAPSESEWSMKPRRATDFEQLTRTGSLLRPMSDMVDAEILMILSDLVRFEMRGFQRVDRPVAIRRVTLEVPVEELNGRRVIVAGIHPVLRKIWNRDIGRSGTDSEGLSDLLNWSNLVVRWVSSGERMAQKGEEGAAFDWAYGEIATSLRDEYQAGVGSAPFKNDPRRRVSIALGDNATATEALVGRFAGCEIQLFAAEGRERESAELLGSRAAFEGAPSLAGEDVVTLVDSEILLLETVGCDHTFWLKAARPCSAVAYLARAAIPRGEAASRFRALALDVQDGPTSKTYERLITFQQATSELGLAVRDRLHDSVLESAMTPGGDPGEAIGSDPVVAAGRAALDRDRAELRTWLEDFGNRDASEGHGQVGPGKPPLIVDTTGVYGFSLVLRFLLDSVGQPITILTRRFPSELKNPISNAVTELCGKRTDVFVGFVPSPGAERSEKLARREWRTHAGKLLHFAAVGPIPCDFVTVGDIVVAGTRKWFIDAPDVATVSFAFRSRVVAEWARDYASKGKALDAQPKSS